MKALLTLMLMALCVQVQAESAKSTEEKTLTSLKVYANIAKGSDYKEAEKFRANLQKLKNICENPLPKNIRRQRVYTTENISTLVLAQKKELQENILKFIGIQREELASTVARYDYQLSGKQSLSPGAEAIIGNIDSFSAMLTQDVKNENYRECAKKLNLVLGGA